MIYPIVEGKHNNLHLSFYLGKKNKRIYNAKLVVFLETGNAYITYGKFLQLDESYFNHDTIFSKIEKDLDKLDFKLVKLPNESLVKKQITTEELLNQLNI